MFIKHKGVADKILVRYGGFVYALVLLQNENLASGSADKTIKIWNVNGGNLITTLNGHKGSVCSLALLDNGFLASSGGIDDKTIKIWDVYDWSLIKSLEGHTGNIAFIPISSNALLLLKNGRLTSAITDRTTKTWNTKIN